RCSLFAVRCSLFAVRCSLFANDFTELIIFCNPFFVFSYEYFIIYIALIQAQIIFGWCEFIVSWEKKADTWNIFMNNPKILYSSVPPCSLGINL
ncbi:MAG: hypothetical protein ACI4E1_04270, partial [Lachnospira sp.]